MDKKNTTIGVLLIAAAFAFIFLGPKPTPPAAPPAEVRQIVAQQQAGAPAQPPAMTPNGPQAAFASAVADDNGANGPELQNDFIKVRFTSAGGAIRDVALVANEAGRKKYPAVRGREEPFIFNEHHLDPMLALVEFPGLDRGTRFQLVSQTATEVVYRAVLDHRLEVTRRYTLAPNKGPNSDPYQIGHETTFKNLTDQTAPPIKVALSLGTAAPVNAADTAQLLSTGHSDGKSQTFNARGRLEASGGLFGFGAHGASATLVAPGPIVWGTVTNQFFASILTPAEPAASLVTRRVKLLLDLPDEVPNAYGISAAAQFDVKALAPHGETSLAASLYVGPKEYRRLANGDVFKADQDKVMQYGFWGWASKLLITLMTAIHGALPQATWGWGLSIILTTLSLKLIFLWPTFAAARSMRRMQKLQPQLTALREKFKDNPQKLQSSMMELYKEHKINPLGGCIPMLIPLPFFIGFFSMLNSTAELRFAPFLWAGDLSAPDHVGTFLGIGINILPLLLTATTFVQMRLTPTPNADPTQAKIMQFMPLIFLFIYYNFSCALSIYSTTNALFTIGQQLVINRMKDDGDPSHAVKGPAGKPIKNVTPKKK